MLRVRSRKQQHLFDPWRHLSPKRREMLDKGWAGFFREHVLDNLPVKKLAMLFPSERGRPTKDLSTVVGTLALQQYHDLTDLETCEQLAFNIQWHYALDIAEESDEAKYICPKTLWNMRILATELELEADLFDAVTQTLIDGFQVDTGHQRQDSVHIRSNMARLSRVGIFVKGIDRFLVNLKRHHRPLWDQLDADLIQRYQGEKARQCFAAVKPSESKRVLSEVAADLYRLVKQFEADVKVPTMSSYKLLCRILREQCEVRAEGTVEVKVAKQIPSDSLQNPSDPDATYSGHKGQGYQLQVMETFSEHEGAEKDPAELNLITYVKVERACDSDAQALLPALEQTLAKDRAPEELQADALYGSDENCQRAEQLGVTVVSPAMGREKRQSANLSDFTFLTNGHVDKCPAGHEPVSRKKKKDRYTQCFGIDVCAPCPLAAECPAKKGATFFYVRYTDKDMRLARRRQYEKTEAFQAKYRWRAGIEATMSQLDRLTGVKHLRVRGHKAVRFAAVMKATALNLARAVAVRRARMRIQGPNPDSGTHSRGLLSLIKEQCAAIWGSVTDWVARKPKIVAYAGC